MTATNKNAVDKGSYPHFMLKEIMEQPEVLRRTLAKGIASIEQGQLSPEYGDLRLGKYQKVLVLACGTAYHAGLVGKYFMEKLARVPVTVEQAAEFRYTDSFVDPDTLVLVISQSGETGDTLAAMREAKSKGGYLVAITNVAGSTIAREAHRVINTVAGAEISVASTKAYMAQLATLYLLGLQLAMDRGRLGFKDAVPYLKAMKKIPEQVEQLLAEQATVKEWAGRLAGNEHAFFLGRGLDAAVAMEGSLKLKETTYIHAEAYSAGEFRHGPIALIEEGIPAVILATQPELVGYTVPVMEELKSRGAWIIGILGADTGQAADCCDYRMILPATLPEFTPMPAVIPLQLLAYYTACARGNDVDQPRHLVKSVKDVK